MNDPRASRSCPACGHEHVDAAAFEAEVPALLNVVVVEREEARRAPRARLALHECLRCGFVWNAAFEGLVYDASYVVDASRSPRYRRHLESVADRVVEVGTSSDPLVIVEVAAGQGGFLGLVVERHGARVAGAFGIDPAFRAEAASLPPSVSMIPCLLEALPRAAVPPRIDVVVARHVIEHVSEPVAFLESIAERFGGHAGFSLLVETPNVAHTLERGLLHDFCYEHCSMFTARALAIALERAGFGDVDVDETAFDGEYLLARASLGAAARAASDVGGAAREPRLGPLAVRFVREQRARLAEAPSPVVLWGAAGKGALFAWLVDPDGELVAGVVDILEAKQGSYLPGAGHVVLAPEHLRELGTRAVFASNPTYEAEIRRRVAELDPTIRVLAVGDDPPRLERAPARREPDVG